MEGGREGKEDKKKIEGFEGVLLKIFVWKVCRCAEIVKILLILCNKSCSILL